MSNRRTQHPALESQEEIKESLEIGLRRRGDPLDGFVTFRDLKDSGLIQSDFQGGNAVLRRGPGLGGPGTISDPIDPIDFGQNDLTRPPAPTGVRARGINLNTIGVTWNPPAYNNHAYSEVFASFVDDWDAIAASFNTGRPIESGNQTQFYMGTAAGTTFVHSALGSTIPTMQLERPLVETILQGDNNFTVFLDGDQSDFAATGDTAYLNSDDPWDGNGIQGEIVAISYSSGTGLTTVLLDGPTSFDAGYPAGAILVVVPDPDELDIALNPRPIYYWVRFVSTAQVPGPVQSQAGVSGTVMANPEEILNILTGRIRSSQLAQDIISPINFIRGPITEVDEEGNRLFPTVRDFVNSLGGDLISEYDETLEEVFLGFLEGPEPQEILLYVWIIAGIPATPKGILRVPVANELGAVVGNTVRVNAAPGTLLEPISGLDLLVVESFFNGDSWQYTVELAESGAFPGDESQPYESPGATLSLKPGTGTEYDGIAAAAAYVLELAGQVSADGAWIESLETLQAAFEDTDPDIGLRQIISTIQSRELVRASDEGALAYIADTMQVEFGGGTVALNEAVQVIESNEESINQSITFKAQRNVGGVLFSAGFGLGLESGPAEAPLSTFAVAADQFAIMSAASHGRILNRIAAISGQRYRLTVEHNQEIPGVDDGLDVDARVTLTIPFGSPISGLKGKAFKVYQRNAVSDPQFDIFVEPLGDDVDDWYIGGINIDLTETPHAVFPEQSVPFIVRTDTEDGVPVIGIRGRLIVDGMITATEIEVTDLLRANEIWAGGITSFGLINTSSLIGEVIATPRFAGWAVKMRSPDTSFNSRVFEYSRWLLDTDDLPEAGEPGEVSDVLRQAELYPQLQNGVAPDDTAFWLDAQGKVFVRGSLVVGGQSRFMNTAQNVPATHFVQMDREFPFIVYPFDQLVPGMDVPIHDSWNYSAPGIKGAIRSNALLWIEKNGTMGFNTRNGAIFAGDTPLEPPSGWGFITVINRLDSGAITGLGRVWVSVSFQQRTSLNWPDSLVGCSYLLFLADAGKDYGGQATTFVPSQRTGAPPGGVGSSPSQSQLDFLDTHFLIIRASTNTGLNPDPGYMAYQAWRSQHPELRLITEYYNHSPPGNRLIQGAIDNVPAGDYKLMVVIIERAALNGDRIFGASGPRIMPVDAHFFGQQVSTVPYDGPTVGNTGTAGGTPPDTDPYEPPPWDPNDPTPLP